ncbi:MAG: type II toxin-antitoxin system RelE/ParE family toxin [Acidobacteriota bacterium]
MLDKALLWLGSSRSDIRRFPANARGIVGFQLRRLQQGLEPNDWKPMPSIGPGVREIRIHTQIEHRVVYIARFTEAIYVLHAFEKRSAKTSRRHVDLVRARLQLLLAHRRRTK